MSLVVNTTLPLAAGAGGSVSVAPTLAVSGTPPQATVGVPYSWTPTITGAQGSLRATLDGGLPNGLAVNSGTGEVRGTPVTEQSTGAGFTYRDDLNVAYLPGLTFTVTPGAGGGGGLPPTAITLSALNRQAVDGYSVETWRGREILLASADQPGCRISVKTGSPFWSQGQRGEPHAISAQQVSAGAIGSKRTLTLIAQNAAGSVEQSFEMTTKPYVADASKVVAFFDLSDPALIEIDPANNRVKKVTDKLFGRTLEHPGGYANAPGTNAPVFDPATKRMTWTAASAQYLKLMTDAVNDPLRQFLNGTKKKLSVIFVCAPTATGRTQGIFDFRNNGVSKNIGRFTNGSGFQGLSWIRATDATPGLSVQSLFSTDAAEAADKLEYAPGVYDMYALNTSGTHIWGFHKNRSNKEPQGDVRATPTTITDLEIGRSQGNEYFGGVIKAILFVAEDAAADMMRGLYDTNKAAWELPDRVEPEMFPFSIREDDPLYDTGFDGIQVNPTFETDFTKPTGWVPAIGDHFTRFGVGAANDTENAWHVDPRWSGNANALTTELTKQGKRVLRFKPLAQANLDAAVSSFIATQGARYSFAGSVLSSRRFVAPGPSQTLEMLMQNPPYTEGNFGCFGWTLAEAGGHPPEHDVNEQSNVRAPKISHGYHAAPRWPLMGTRIAFGGDGGLARTHMDREQHSYQTVFDALTDTVKLYMDGYLYSTQKAQKGITIASMKALKADLIAGVGRGSNILAANGTTTGTLFVRFATADASAPCTVALKIVNGEAVDFYWDQQSDGTRGWPCTPGSYFKQVDEVPLILQKQIGGGWGAVTFQGGSGTPPDISKLRVGMNDPVVPEGFHIPMYLIVNNAAGGFTGTPATDQSSEGNVARVMYHSIKRAPVVVSGATATRANNHCTALFNAIGARGTAVSTEDRNLTYDIVSKLMQADFMAGKPMDGSDAIMDFTNHRTLWDAMGLFGMFVGPYDGLVDWKDPTNVFTLQGAPAKSAALGYSFDGRAGGGQFIDTVKLLSNTAQFGRWANGLSFLLTQNNMSGAAAKVPIIGAVGDVSVKLAGPDLTRDFAIGSGAGASTVTVPDCFSLFLGNNVPITTESGRAALGPGFYSATKREQHATLHKNGNRRVPWFAGLIAARDYDTGHTPATIPAQSLKVGSEGPGVQGAAASIGCVMDHRFLSDEEHAFLLKTIKPWFDKYGAPLGL